jgi:hypothetical protein
VKPIEHLGQKEKDYLKGKINELETNKNKHITDLYRDVNQFKKGYQPSRSSECLEEMETFL